jgi:protein phosphatase 2C-like protein
VLTHWRLLGASVTGTSHTKSGLPCQDAHAYREVAGCALLVVADGAGSAEHSAEGAQCASQAALSALSAALAGGWPADINLWRDLFAAAYATAKAELEQLAGAAGLPVRTFATTLLCAALSDSGLAVAQLGDGVAAAFAPSGNPPNGSDWFLAAQPQRGEYANETYFLGEPDALQHLDVAVYAEPVRALALMTDGLLRLVLNAQRQPHVPFFEPLLTFGVEVDDEGQGNGQLAGFLASERVCARTDDDKTVVLALRLPPGWGA